MQNMQLAMHALGLGEVWISAYPKKERIIKIRKMLNAPDNIIPFALTPVGYPDEKHIKIDRFDTQKIHKNEWNYNNA
jgi:nitroreductase